MGAFGPVISSATPARSAAAAADLRICSLVHEPRGPPSSISRRWPRPARCSTAAAAPLLTSISTAGSPLTLRFTTTNGRSALSWAIAVFDSRGLTSTTPSTCLARIAISSSSARGSSSVSATNTW